MQVATRHPRRQRFPKSPTEARSRTRLWSMTPAELPSLAPDWVVGGDGHASREYIRSCCAVGIAPPAPPCHDGEHLFSQFQPPRHQAPGSES